MGVKTGFSFVYVITFASTKIHFYIPTISACVVPHSI